MPKRGYRRRHWALRGAGLAGGLAKQAYRAAKRYSGRKRKGAPAARTRPLKRMRSRSATRTRYKRKRSNSKYAGNELNKSRRKVTMGRLTVKKQLYAARKTKIERCQGLTQFDTNSGYNRISYAKVGELMMLPIHAFDLTSFNQSQDGVPIRPTIGKRFGWTNDTSLADVNRIDLYGTNNAGSQATTYWHPEDGVIEAFEQTKIMTEWFDIRLNLYGARKRTTTFTVSLVQCVDDFSNLMASAGSNGELKSLIQYMERPLLFSNLQTGLTDISKKLKVLKRWNYVVAPTTTIDLNTTTGKIQEVKIFMKHNQVFNLDWKKAATILPHQVGDGIDFNYDMDDAQLHPINKKRVYLVITAFCPELTTIANGDFETPTAAAFFGRAGTPVDASIEPSYDFLIRRKVSVM